MIALGSSRTPDVAEPVVEGLPTNFPIGCTLVPCNPKSRSVVQTPVLPVGISLLAVGQFVGRWKDSWFGLADGQAAGVIRHGAPAFHHHLQHPARAVEAHLDCS